MMSSRSIVILTSSETRKIHVSDRLLCDALERRGFVITGAVWNECRPSELAAATCVIMRSVWDYPDAPKQFEGFLENLATERVPIVNSMEVLRWGYQKTYLDDLAARGVPIPKTCRLDRFPSDPAAFVALCEQFSGDRLVTKPCCGGEGRAVRLIDVRNASLQADTLRELYGGSSVIVQEFMPEISKGELSFVFFGRQFSHAMRRIPAPGEFRVNRCYGRPVVQPVNASQDMIDQAAAMIAVPPETPYYARLDCIERAGKLICVEMELVDPYLFLDYAPGAAERLADCITGNLDHIGALARRRSAAIDQ